MCKQVFYLILFLFLPQWMIAGMFDNLVFRKIVTGMQFTEGPSWHPDGYLVFTDVQGNKIYKWSETEGLVLLVDNSGNANGIGVNRSNDMYVCQQGLRQVVKLDTLGNVSPVINQWNGKKFNSPNDLVVSYLGSLYFTDPDFGVSNRELTFEGVYCLPYNSSNLVLLDSSLIKPNGLTFNYDWKTLFVCESSTNTVYSYSLKSESTVDLNKDKKLFANVNTTGEIDGICSDMYGNLYIACGTDGVKIYNRSATLIGTIAFPSGEKVRNLCFGGKYFNQLFVTAETSVYQAEIRFNGDFIATGLLGAPSNHSIVFNALSDKTMDAYISYGTDSLTLSQTTSVTRWLSDFPMEIKINDLLAGQKYYYQLFYKLLGESDFKKATSGSFYTQRNPGDSFSFAVEADPHLDENSNHFTFRNTLQNQLNLQPDFMIDLGDNFMTEKFPLVNYYYVEQRNLLYRGFWDQVCHRMPLFLVVGNHEGELGWLNTNQSDDLFNMATAIRKIYYPNPFPDDFYSGNTASELYVGQRENYYAWQWGDALFVVIDPYEYTLSKPTEPWGYTLGKTQYDWFRTTLENSQAKFKFVFSHQIVGGDKEGRGGAERVHLSEMGGSNIDGSYGFDLHRSGWGKPLHQIMKENGVQIFFHGHDHLYVEQVKDGVVYLEVPQPSLPNYTSVSSAPSYGYVSGVILPNSGHINVSVLGDSALVDYIAGYHVNNVGLNQVNGVVKRHFSVKANKINTSVPPLNETPFEVYMVGKEVYVKSPQQSFVSLHLLDVNGKKISDLFQGQINEGISKFSVLSTLEEGVYIIHLVSKSSASNYKIVYRK